MFLSYRWSTPRYLKAEILEVPQKVRTVLVWYLLLEIHILVYSFTGCGTSKIYRCLEDNRSSFSRVSLKSETKDARTYATVLFCLLKIYVSENKNLMSNIWRWINFYFILNSCRWTNLLNLCGNYLLVLPMLHLRYPHYLRHLWPRPLFLCFCCCLFLSRLISV